MALRTENIVGFENLDLSEVLQASSNWSASRSNVRTGDACATIASGNTGELQLRGKLKDVGTATNHVVGFAVRFSDVTPAAAFRFCSAVPNTSSSAFNFELRLATDGDLEIYDATGTLRGTITTPFTVDTYHFIELVWQNVNSGSLDVYIDVAAGGAATLAIPTQDWDGTNGWPDSDDAVYLFDGLAAASCALQLDDFYARSDAVAGDRLGACQVFGWTHAKTGVAPDAGSGGQIGGDLQSGAWEDTRDALDQLDGEFTSTGRRATVDFQGPGTLGIKVDHGNAYADTSDAGPTDPDTVWNNDANAFDGDIATGATGSINGTRTTNELRGAGTNVAGTGPAFDRVAVRVSGSSAGGGATTIEVFEDAEAALLGSVFLSVNTTVGAWTPWVILTVPSGGWTRAKIQALEFIIFKTAGSSQNSIEAIEVGLFADIANDADIIATKTVARIDRDGGAASLHILSLSHSGDGNNATEFNDDTHFVTITQTNAWREYTATNKLPSTAQNIRAGFGTLGAQDIHMYDSHAMLLHVPPAVGDRIVTCTTEVLELAENAATVNATRDVAGTTEVLELDENGATVNRTREVVGTTEVLELAELAAAVNASRLVVAIAEVLELTELAATVTRGGGAPRIVNCTTEVLRLTELGATVNRTREVVGTTEVLELAELAAVVNGSRLVVGISEVLELTEQAAAVNRSRAVVAIAEVLELAENAASVNRTREVVGATEVLELTELAAVVTRGGNRIVNCTTEVLELTENGATVNRSREVISATEVIELTESAAAVNRSREVVGTTEVLELTEQAATVTQSRVVIGATEVLELAETAAAINRSRLVIGATEVLELTENTADVITGGVTGTVIPFEQSVIVPEHVTYLLVAEHVTFQLVPEHVTYLRAA